MKFRTLLELLGDSGLTPTARAAVLIYDHAGNGGQVLLRDLALWLGVSETTARRAIREAATAGWLRWSGSYDHVEFLT